MRRTGIAAGFTLAANVLLAGDSCAGPAELHRQMATKKTSEAWASLGKYFAGSSRFECAAEAFRKALALAPGSPKAHYNLALSYMQRGQPAQAATEFRQTLALNQTWSLRLPHTLRP